jgi:hypothetical protein
MIFNKNTSSRQAMEQVMDAVVDADVDVAFPQLSQPSQLTEDNRFSLTEDVVVLQKIIDLADVNVALRYLNFVSQQFTFVTGCMMRLVNNAS